MAYRFSVLVSLEPTLAGVRRAFDADDGRLSFRRWRRSPVVRMRDLFSAAEWGSGARTVYLAFVFEKGDDTESGVGTGVVVDDLFVGRRRIEVLAERTYDVSVCASLGTAPPCDVGDETIDAPLGQLTKLTSYQDGRKVTERSFAYRGLNGRASGIRELVDWTGVGDLAPERAADFAWSWLHEPWGAVSEMIYPRAPTEEGVQYEWRWSRGLLGSFAESGSAGPHEFFWNPLAYDAAAALRQISFVNGTAQAIDRDALYRPMSFVSSGPLDAEAEGPDCDGSTADGDTDRWCSGTYAFDAAGNITAIGGQAFKYDQLGRLRESRVRPQASDPAQQALDILTNVYDPFGNMVSQTFVNAPTPAPVGLSFVHGVDPATNRISSRTSGGVASDFVHDAAGNLMRFPGKLEQKVGSAWDAAGRMRVFFDSVPSCAGTAFECALPVEESAYDAAGYRVVHIDARGRPVISLRQGDGQVLAEFAVSNADNAPQLERHLLYGAGQLLVERPMVAAPPRPRPRPPFWNPGETWYLDPDPVDPMQEMMADVAAPSGHRRSVTGLVPDAAGQFAIPESALSLGETNTIRFRRTSPEESAYSDPVNVVIDPAVTAGTPNQTRALALARDGENLVLRWELFSETGQTTRVYFKPEGAAVRVLLTPMALAAGTRQLVLNSQTYSLGAGAFTLDAVIPGQPTQTSIPLQTLSCAFFGSTSGGRMLVDRFHHRDHLGSLRVAFDEQGWPMARHDFYPFGAEMRPGLAESRRMFTGHERDAESGLDYMLARYGGSNLARLLSVDPGASVSARYPQSWNRYAYAANSPLMLVDPSGMIPRTPGSGGARNPGTGYFRTSVPYFQESTDPAHQENLGAPPSRPCDPAEVLPDDMTIVIQTDIDPQENGRYDQSMAIDAVCHAFREITENPIGLKLLDDLGTKEITIVVTNRENSERIGRTDSVLWNPTQGVMHQTNNGVESPATILFHELRHIAEGVFSDHPAERGIMDPVVAETNRYLRYEGIPGRQHYYDGGRMTTWGPASTEFSTRSKKEWPYAW